MKLVKKTLISFLVVSLAFLVTKNSFLAYAKDKDTLSSTVFMYSDLANIDDQRDIAYSIEALKEFENIVVVRPKQMSSDAIQVVDQLKDNSNIFGYINLGPNNPNCHKRDWDMADIDKLKTQIDSISDAGWYGIFIDQFGYDWGETRERQNIIIDYAHEKNLSVMANAWYPKDALDKKIDKKSNPEGLESNLNSNDWFLVESFYTDGNSYRADSSYIDKYIKAKEHSEKTGVKISTLSYKRNCTSWDQDITDIDIRNSYILAHVLGFDSWSFIKYGNCNNLLYGSIPDIDLGDLIKPLKLDSDNKYLAETENYIIEYIAEKTPTLNLISK